MSLSNIVSSGRREPRMVDVDLGLVEELLGEEYRLEEPRYKRMLGSS